MGFDSGSISFRRFAVIGQQPDAIDQSLLDQLAEHRHQDDVEYGWCAGRHILDQQFSFDNNVFTDALHLALRIDTNNVPSELSKAYRMIEEEAAAKGNPSGFISKAQRRDAKQSAQEKIEDEVRTGKFRRSKVVPILWDFPSGMLFCNASIKAEEKLHEIFERTFGLTLQPLSAGALALRFLESRAKRRDYEDVRPTRFSHAPDGESLAAEYPWVAKGAEAKDFLGNEFLVWLWHQADTNGGVVDVAHSQAAVLFQRTLDLDCVFGQTGRDLLRHSNGVVHMPEAMAGLRTGKVPRKSGLIVESSGMQFSLTLAAESLAIRSLTLPKVEDADNPRVLFEERISMLRDFCKTFDALFSTFLATRASSGWESHTTTIQKWITRHSRSAATAVMA